MKKNKIIDYFEQIKVNIISNIVWYIITSIIADIALLVPLVVKIIKNSTIPLYAYILAGVSIALLIIIIVLLTILLMRNSSDKKASLELDFKFSSITAEMTFDDNRKDITSSIDYKMQVLANEISELKRQLIWTGSEYHGTKLVQKNGNYEVEDSTRTSSPYPYCIKFNEKKKRGAIVEFKTETSVTDGNLSMFPVYSFMVKYQIDVLTLRIIAPKGMIKNVKKVVYADSGREVCVEEPIELEGETIRNLVRYTYTIPNPVLLYHYFIEWEFTNS